MLAAGASTEVSVEYNCTVDESIDGTVNVGINAANGMSDAEAVSVRVEVVESMSEEENPEETMVE